MLHIERCIQDLLKEGRLPPSDYAALWVPDKEAVKCMCCHTSHFTVIQRRHHCRACGKVVCSSCSSKSFMLEGISKKPVRVCDTCYNKLCQGMSPKPVAPLGQLVGGGGENSLRTRDSSPINANDSSDSDGEEPLQQQNDWERTHDEVLNSYFK
uniref:FYVE-type domain-containing protein n=1 Tax=Meloidogyne incognita TaxID=6306 RepID=A0A914M6J7_MELIC